MEVGASHYTHRENALALVVLGSPPLLVSRRSAGLVGSVPTNTGEMPLLHRERAILPQALVDGIEREDLGIELRPHPCAHVVELLVGRVQENLE